MQPRNKVEMSRRGYTEVFETWENPLGTRTLYLSWPNYLIDGTQDTRKIGRRSSNGCISLFNEHIEKVSNRIPVGTEVKLI